MPMLLSEELTGGKVTISSGRLFQTFVTNY